MSRIIATVGVCFAGSLPIESLPIMNRFIDIFGHIAGVDLQGKDSVEGVISGIARRISRHGKRAYFACVVISI